MSNIDLQATLLAVAGIEADVEIDGVDVSAVRTIDRTLLGVAMTNTPRLMATISRGDRKLLPLRRRGQRLELCEARRRGAGGAPSALAFAADGLEEVDQSLDVVLAP